VGFDTPIDSGSVKFEDSSIIQWMGEFEHELLGYLTAMYVILSHFHADYEKKA